MRYRSATVVQPNAALEDPLKSSDEIKIIIRRHWLMCMGILRFNYFFRMELINPHYDDGIRFNEYQRLSKLHKSFFPVVFSEIYGLYCKNKHLGARIG